MNQDSVRFHSLIFSSIYENLVFAIWSNGIMRVYYKRDCISEENLFKDEVLENTTVANAIISAHTYPIETNEDGEHHKHIYTAISVAVENNKSLVKIFDLDFSGFENNFEGQTLNYKSDCNLEFSSLSTLCGYSNKTIVDIAIEGGSLW